MAPYLMLGFLVAGFLSVCVSPAWVERRLGGQGLRGVFLASLLGVPLPLCSCGVIPVSASIRRHGAGRGATTAFLISTPQTGVDSIAVTYAMFGWLYAVFRPIAALATGIAGGALAQLVEPEGAKLDGRDAAAPRCGDACCSADGDGRAVRALRYGLVTLPRDIGLPLIIGVVIAGAVGALVPPQALQPYLGGGVVAILLAMAAGLPIYVCATASVPLAAGLMHLGASPGAALAFLIAGPATNAATLSVVWKLLGRRTVAVYLATIACSAVGCGLLLDQLYSATAASIPQLYGHADHAAAATWTVDAWAGLLLVVLVHSFYAGRASRSGPRAADADVGDRMTQHALAAGGASRPESAENVSGVAATGALTESRGATGYQAGRSGRVELVVGGMRCSHCAETVRRALSEAAGVESVEVDLHRGRAMVRGAPAEPQRLVDAVRGLGYSAELVE